MTRPEEQARIGGIVPPLSGWHTFPRAFLNLLVFGLTVFAGEWVVHQAEYVIEYGQWFGAAMGATGHDAYMGPIGLVLAVAAAGLIGLAALTLGLVGITLWRLRLVLPSGMRRLVPRTAQRVSLRTMLVTASVLAFGQIALYAVQENVEAAALGAGWPGLGVLFAPQHATVVPLHLLVSSCGAVILWAVAAILHGSRRAVCIAQALAASIELHQTPQRRMSPVVRHIPNLHALPGALGSRSPPLLV